MCDVPSPSAPLKKFDYRTISEYYFNYSWAAPSTSVSLSVLEQVATHITQGNDSKKIYIYLGTLSE